MGYSRLGWVAPSHQFEAPAASCGSRCKVSTRSVLSTPRYGVMTNSHPQFGGSSQVQQNRTKPFPSSLSAQVGLLPAGSTC